MPEHGVEDDEDNEADVEAEADMGDVRHEVAVGQVGDGEVASQCDKGDRYHCEAVGCSHREQLFAPQGLGGEHHQRNGQQGEFLLQVEEAVGEVAGAEKPHKMHGCHDEERMQQVVLAELAEFLFPVPFDHPVGQQQHP